MLNLDHCSTPSLLGTSTSSAKLPDNGKLFPLACWYNWIPKKPTNSSSYTKNRVKNNDLPTKRWGHSSTIFNKQMIIFGGRQSTKNLANIYSFDLDSSSWSKIDPLGQIPPARDSHSTILLKNELIVFGGSGCGKKLNDLWTFSIESKKWSKIIANGVWPSPREGHSSAIIRNNYIMVYGGIDENEGFLDDMYMLDLRNALWNSVDCLGTRPTLRDSQTCTQVNNTCYIFGGQGPEDALYNDLYSLEFTINESEKKFIAEWTLEKAIGKVPPERTSHTCVNFKNEYLILIGGEGLKQEALNDVWCYNLSAKTWTELDAKNNFHFESRFCHSCCVFNEKLLIFGGMRNSDITLDTLSILSLDGQLPEGEEIKVSPDIGPTVSSFQGKLEAYQNEFLVVSNSVNVLSANGKEEVPSVKQINFEVEDKTTDTMDLFEHADLDLDVLKKRYLNSMISWSFLKKLTDFHQWPLGCIGNLLENSAKKKVESKNIWVEIQVFDKSVYRTERLSNYESIKPGDNSERSMKNQTVDLDVLTQDIDFKNKILTLVTKDDGKGISIKKFNKIMYSFSVSPNNEYNFFKYGLSLKASALRLGNSLLIISKTDTSLSVGLISKNLQSKYNTEFVVTPIVNYAIAEGRKYVPISTMAVQTINMIINEVKFMFYTVDELFAYADSFERGTHIFIYDLKQFSNDPSQINSLSNYELYFDIQRNDILFNYFKIQIGESQFIDCSLKKYIRFLFLKQPELNIFLLNQKLDLNNPLVSLQNVARSNNEICKISGLKSDFQQVNELIVEGDSYKGFLFNESFFNNYIKSSVFEKNFDEKEVFNGVLLYQNNKLVSRYDQTKLGDIYYYVNRYQKKSFADNAKAKLYPISGFVELPSFHEVLPSKMEFRDQALFAYFYNKLNNTIKRINKPKLK